MVTSKQRLAVLKLASASQKRLALILNANLSQKVKVCTYVEAGKAGEVEGAKPRRGGAEREMKAADSLHGNQMMTFHILLV